MANVIVLFEVTIKDGKHDDYLSKAAELKDSLQNADGFICSERFSSLSVKGKLLSKSEWVDEQSVEKWRNNELHRLCQKHGRESDFVDYKITVVTPVRSYTMTERTYAPTDSNQYFGG
ncbi:MAG: antibiotic biosynthesis monooxygenase [Treponema sp.]|nr:antibiotic biosynthesis monooxygenase [Treponema sp.]